MPIVSPVGLKNSYCLLGTPNQIGNSVGIEGLAARHSFNRSDQLPADLTLENTACNSKSCDFLSILPVLMHGQDENSSIRKLAHDFASRLQSIQTRHGNIHYHNRGMQGCDHIDGLKAIRRLTDYVDPFLSRQDLTDYLPDAGVIVHDEYTDLSRGNDLHGNVPSMSAGVSAFRVLYKHGHNLLSDLPAPDVLSVCLLRAQPNRVAA